MYGKEIKEYLNSKGIKKTFLARKLDMNINTLGTMLAGTRKITIEEYVSICKALEVDFNYFYDVIENKGA